MKSQSQRALSRASLSSHSCSFRSCCHEKMASSQRSWRYQLRCQGLHESQHVCPGNWRWASRESLNLALYTFHKEGQELKQSTPAVVSGAWFSNFITIPHWSCYGPVVLPSIADFPFQLTWLLPGTCEQVLHSEELCLFLWLPCIIGQTTLCLKGMADVQNQALLPKWEWLFWEIGKPSSKE